ncbi:MAG: hypothetical protein K6C13_13165 [Oscillospiraceae bacterium]|nr:hypothetical protein [Oscillospiraceae bacterium]
MKFKSDKKRFLPNHGVFIIIIAASILLSGVISLLIHKVIPTNSILVYTNGEFSIRYPAEEYIWMLFLLFGISFVISITGTIIEIIRKQELTKKISHIAAFVLLSVIMCFALSFEYIGLTGWGDDWFLPYGNNEEYTFSGHHLVLSTEPVGMHHSRSALYEIIDDRAYKLGCGKDINGKTSDYNVQKNKDSYIVTYKEEINGETVLQSYECKDLLSE